MKALILAALFLAPGLTMAGESAWEGDYTNPHYDPAHPYNFNYYYNPGRHDYGYGQRRYHRPGRRVRGCREGATRYFTNDGYCSNGNIRNTFRVCRGGRYVIVRVECYGSGR